MHTPPLRRFATVALVGLLASGPSIAADAPASSSKSGAAASTKSGSSRGAARGPLPDPTLLDGSAHPAAKKSEHGMIGDFELPGDENANPSKVGGGNGGPGGGQPNDPQNPQIKIPLPGVPSPLGVPGGQGGLPAGLPTGGGLGTDPTQQGGLPQIPNPLGGAQGAQQAGQQGGQPMGQQGSAQGGAQGGGQPGGVQVGGLQGESAAGNNPAGQPGGKPSNVTIGDSAMRIEPSAGAAASVGNQQVAGQTQQHEKGTGTGGKQATGVQSGNRVEKGRAIPAGL